jgi:hypothetical protein
MKNIKLFDDFLVEGEDQINKVTKFTMKDYYNVLDLFQGYADDYKMTEWVEGIEKKSDIYFEIGVAANLYVDIWLKEEAKDLFPEILEKMKNNFVPLLEKWGYHLLNKVNTDHHAWITIGEDTLTEVSEITMVFYK